jgi:hypothetical protein
MLRHAFRHSRKSHSLTGIILITRFKIVITLPDSNGIFCGLLNDAISTEHYKALKGRVTMSDSRRVSKDTEGNGRGLIKVMSLELTGSD